MYRFPQLSRRPKRLSKALIYVAIIVATFFVARPRLFSMRRVDVPAGDICEYGESAVSVYRTALATDETDQSHGSPWPFSCY